MKQIMVWKHVLAIAAIWAGCASCQQEEYVGGNDQQGQDYIGFSIPAVAVETATKATTIDALPQGEQFGVLGYCVPYRVGTTELDYGGGDSYWATKHGHCSPSVFYNQAVTVSDGYCNYTPLKHWYGEGTGLDGESINNAGMDAEDYRYTFFAYYPYRATDPVFSIDAPGDASTAGAPKFTFTMPQSGTALTDELDYTATPDAMFAVLYNRQKSQGSLDFAFSHMLTALGFEVNNFSEYELQIHSIRLSGRFFKQITLDFSQSNDGTLDKDNYGFPAQYYTGYYNLYDDNNGASPLVLAAPADVEERTTSGLLPRNAQTGVGEHIMLISGSAPYFGPDGPDSSGNTQVQISIEYTFNEQPGSFSTGRPSTFTPTPGTKYTAQLNFVGDTFVLQFVVDNNEQWENGETDDNGDAVFE